MLYQPFMRVLAILSRSNPVDDFRSFFRRFCLDHAGPVQQPMDMRIHGNGIAPEIEVHDEIRYLGANSLQGQQCFSCPRNFTTMPLDELPAHLLQLDGFSIVVGNWLDEFL